jgi:NAD(P)-dependent dehydrogenase (short-subunit alcohol dehydrogenase family)
MRGLDGKNVIVTGGGGAIGGAICRRFAGYGARVGVFDKNLEGAQKVAVEIKGFASGVDITDYDGVAKAIAQFEKEVGPTDILVNNAGWDRFVNFVDTTPDLWDQIIAINLRGALNMSHVVLKGMVSRGRGRVVNIASDAGRVGSCIRPARAASSPSPRPSRARWRAKASRSTPSVPARPTRRCWRRSPAPTSVARRSARRSSARSR